MFILKDNKKSLVLLSRTGITLITLSSFYTLIHTLIFNILPFMVLFLPVITFYVLLFPFLLSLTFLILPVTFHFLLSACLLFYLNSTHWFMEH